jgi:hypothetical protein
MISLFQIHGGRVSNRRSIHVVDVPNIMGNLGGCGLHLASDQGLFLPTNVQTTGVWLATCFKSHGVYVWLCTQAAAYETTANIAFLNCVLSNTAYKHT